MGTREEWLAICEGEGRFPFRLTCPRRDSQLVHLTTKPMTPLHPHQGEFRSAIALVDFPAARRTLCEEESASYAALCWQPLVISSAPYRVAAVCNGREKDGDRRS